MTLGIRLLKLASLTSIIVLCALPAAGAETAAGWRDTYDVVMRWINFIILAVLLIKYAYPPLKHFLNIKQKEINAEIRKLETEKQTVLEALNESIAAGKAHDQHIDMMRDKIAAEGEDRKQQIIEDAKTQCDQMIVNARRRIENDLKKATQQLRVELVDAAVDQAARVLPQKMTDHDNQRILEHFLDADVAR